MAAMAAHAELAELKKRKLELTKHMQKQKKAGLTIRRFALMHRVIISRGTSAYHVQ